MNNRGAAIGAAVIVSAGIVWAAAHGRAQKPAASPTETVRNSVILTVYKDDFGMAQETRPVQLAAGSNKLRITDVSKMLDPQSVLLGWQDKSSAAQIVAHAYDLGVASGDGLLKRYLGKEIEVVRYGQDGHEAERQKGTLMINSGDNVTLENDGKFIVNPQGTIVAPVTADIIPIPQLSVQADSPNAQAANLSVTYLTRGLSWSADYVATLAPDTDTLSLECWATVTNRTGADYPNAKVTLVAGSPNRAVQAAPSGSDGAGHSVSAGRAEMRQEVALKPSAPRAPAFAAPENIGEYHEYPVKSATTVVQEQMNRLLMLSSANVSIVRDYNARAPELSGYDYSDYGWGSPKQPVHGSVAVAITFHNREKDGLGQPLPQGAIRIYEPDFSGTLRYSGAASIADTPRDQPVYMTLGNAFDVFTESKVVKKQRMSKHVYRKEIELTLHNEKAAPVYLRVVQGLSGRWKIVSESSKHSKPVADSAQWKIHLPARSATPLRYTIDFAI